MLADLVLFLHHLAPAFVVCQCEAKRIKNHSISGYVNKNHLAIFYFIFLKTFCCSLNIVLTFF